MSLKIGSVFSIEGNDVPLADQFYWHEVIKIDDEAVYAAKRLKIFED